MSPSCLVLAAGTANPSLARAVARELDVPIASADIGRFPDGEVRIRLDEPVGVEHLFVTDSLAGPGERCAVDGLRLHVVSIATAVAAAIRLQLVERSDAKPRRIA